VEGAATFMKHCKGGRKLCKFGNLCPEGNTSRPTWLLPWLFVRIRKCAVSLLLFVAASSWFRVLWIVPAMSVVRSRTGPTSHSPIVNLIPEPLLLSTELCTDELTKLPGLHARDIGASYLILNSLPEAACTRCKYARASQVPGMRAKTFHESYGKFGRLNFEVSCYLHYSACMKHLRHLTRTRQIASCKRGLRRK
jgi:hypothetical protein